MTTCLAQTLWQNISAGGPRDFFVAPGQRLTCADLARGIRRWLGLFDAAGLGPGDRVIIRTHHDEIACVAFLAGLVDGVVPVLLEGACPDARLRAIAGMVEPGLVLSDGPALDLADGVRSMTLATGARRSGLRLFAAARPDVEFGLENCCSERQPRQPETDGLAYLLFTSGTTAAPGGVMISRANLAANLATLTRLFSFTKASRIFNDMVLAHADGMIQGPVLAAWTGAAVLRAGGFDVSGIEDWLGSVRRLRASHVITVPTVWALIDQFAAHDDYFDAPECQMLMSVAARLPEALWDRIEKRFQRPLMNQYGLTETVASALYAGKGPALGAHGTIGRPVDCAARIAGGGDEGELELRGDNIFSGYWRNPQRTAECFTADGWFRTGDKARQRSDGSYEVIGRLKTAIVSGGVLIWPEEIDNALLCHPAVVESVTLGIADAVFGEIAISCVVLASPSDETALTEHLRHHVEPRKVPKHVVIFPSLPRGISGKPKLDVLRAEVAGRLAAVSGLAARADHSSDVLAIAAKVFRVPVASLALSTTPKDQAAWDSFTQLNLVLAIEDHFGCHIPAARVSALRSLGDFVRAIDAAA